MYIYIYVYIYIYICIYIYIYIYKDLCVVLILHVDIEQLLVKMEAEKQALKEEEEKEALEQIAQIERDSEAARQLQIDFSLLNSMLQASMLQAAPCTSESSTFAGLPALFFFTLLLMGTVALYRDCSTGLRQT